MQIIQNKSFVEFKRERERIDCVIRWSNKRSFYLKIVSYVIIESLNTCDLFKSTFCVLFFNTINNNAISTIIL